MNNSDPILLFDGVCNLCNGLVRFIEKRDNNGRIRFVPLQSDTGKSLLLMAGLSPDSIDTGEKILFKSAAVLNLLKSMGGGWRLFYCLIIIPPFIRDLFYNLIAKNRYKLFGKRESCEVT
jgi:predicted DCC family thiol-disulfide oxidoreductase YuxK